MESHIDRLWKLFFNVLWRIIQLMLNCFVASGGALSVSEMIGKAMLVAMACVMLFVGSSDGQAERFSEKLRLGLSDATDKIAIAHFNSDGSKILIVGWKTAEVLEAATGKRLAELRGGVNLLDDGFEFYWQPRGTRILQFKANKLSKKSTAILWDGSTGERIAILEEDRGVRSVEWSSDGRRILTVGGSVGGSGSTGFWDKLSYSIRDENGQIKIQDRMVLRDLRLLRFSAVGDGVFWSFKPEEGQRSIQVFEADTGKFLRDFDHDLPTKELFTYAVFAGESPDGNYFCGQIEISKGVTCWNAADDTKTVYSFLDTKTTGDQIFLDFSPDSKHLTVLRTREKVIDIADAATGKTKFLIDLPNGTRRVTSSSARPNRFYDYGNVWSRDGRFYVVTDVEKQVSIWDVSNGRLVSRRPTIWDTSYDLFVGHLPSDYERFSFNSKNNLLLSVSLQVARVWDAETGKLLRQFGASEKRSEDRTAQSYRASWSPDGRYLLTAADKNKSLILWSVNN